MGGRKRTATGTMLESSTNTDNTSDTDFESNNEEPIPSTSGQTKHHVNSLCMDSNNELLKENPFLIPSILACLCEHSSRQALFKYRLVGQHIWNELAVNAINQCKSAGVRLVKIFDPDEMHGESISETTGTMAVVNIKELISTIHAGRLEKSTLNRIHLNSSLSLHDLNLNIFLQLSGQNIRTLHYDKASLPDLRQILQTCSQNLMSLSLWYSTEDEENKEGLFENVEDTFQFPRLENFVIVSGELNPRLTSIRYDNNICKPSKEFLSHLFQASPNLKSLSARFYDSFILESGLSFMNLTTLCIKFKIRIHQLRTLCDVGLRLKKLRLQGLFMFAPLYQVGVDDDYRYFTDPEWMDFRKTLLEFIQTQAYTLEYFAVSLFVEKDFGEPTEHDSPHEQWSSMTGFPIMPNLVTLILYECSGKIPKEEFGYLFPKLRNLELIGCRHRQVAGLPESNIMNYPLEIPISSSSSICVRNIRRIKPTIELAQIFPSIIEFHIQNEIPHELPNFWPKLKHMYYKESCKKNSETEVTAYIRIINQFLVGISPKESKRIEKLGQRIGFDELTKLELPRSRPSIFDLNELETFEFGFDSYEFEARIYRPRIETALGVLVTLGLSRMSHLKKLNVILEQKPRRRFPLAFPRTSLDGLVNTFSNRKYLNTFTNSDDPTSHPIPRKWTMELNLDHHKSEWKEIDGLFRDDPDICELGLSVWTNYDSDEENTVAMN